MGYVRLMKIKATLFLFSLLFVFGAHSQVYFRVSSGFGLPLAKQVIFTDFISGSSGEYAYGGPEGSFGKGLTYGISSGYKFKKVWQGEIGFEYLSSAKMISSAIDSMEYGGNITSERKLSCNLMNIIPAVIYTIGEKKFKISIRAGFLLGFNGKIISKKVFAQDFLGNISVRESDEVFGGGIAWGFSGGIGLNYALNKLIHLSAEATFHAQTWSPDKSYYTKYNDHGVDMLPSFPVSAKEFEYHKNISYGWPYHSSDNPAIMSRQYFPFSSYGLTFGVSFILDFSKIDSKMLPE